MYVIFTEFGVTIDFSWSLKGLSHENCWKSIESSFHGLGLNFNFIKGILRNLQKTVQHI